MLQSNGFPALAIFAPLTKKQFANMKAFLGTGLLGSGFIRAMLKRGDTVQVWNRTASKALALEADGARAFEQVADAVSGASLIHLALRDDASVDEVLEAAAPGMAAGTIIIDHTTTSKEGALRRTQVWKERGFYYQHAPVFMGPANALEASGFMLLSGDRALIEKVQPELAKMTGQILQFGEEVGKAAAIKLMGNAYLVCFTSGLRDTLAVAKSLGLSVGDVSSLLNTWNPGAQVHARLSRMTAADYGNPSWELGMARKDTGLFLDAAAKAELELAVLPAVAAFMDQWIAKGHGNQDWTVIAKDCF